MSYKIPQATKIGHVHLKVSDLDKALDFYHGLLGFEIMERFGTQAAFISAGDYHHHIGLNTWYSKDKPPAPKAVPGLFHTAILYSTRKELAEIFKRLTDANYPFTGFADHGVSEALYLDKPREQWPFDAEGNLKMVTEHLDLKSLLAELDK